MAPINKKRVKALKDGEIKRGPILYWMSRDQRVEDNWALLYAQELAITRKEPLFVAFCLVPSFLNATIRQYGFMLTGLQELEGSLRRKNIPFYVLCGKPEEVILHFVRKHKVGVLVTDFDPLRIKRRWKEVVKRRINIPFHEVDGHNIIPCWILSSKQEFAARTIRPKVWRALPEFLEEFPKLRRHPYQGGSGDSKVDWLHVNQSLEVNLSVHELHGIRAGTSEAQKVLKHFLDHKLSRYNQSRNDPNLDGQSNLSPYLHFGRISAQRVALEVQNSKTDPASKEAFLEELIVRRELSDNFCFYNNNYDTVEGFPAWARKTIIEHAQDERQYTYSLEQFEGAETHDELWNAAQIEMVKTGKMYGYMRMYWAKKILEWTESPADALQIAIYLNDRYELDGRDPNGYVGCAWSIGGVHDRAWPSRPVFGKIRSMSYKGCKSKFDVESYIAKMHHQ